MARFQEKLVLDRVMGTTGYLPGKCYLCGNKSIDITIGWFM